MSIRRLLAICSLILLGGILVACGSEDEDPEPTAVPTTAITAEPTEAEESTATEQVIATPDSTAEDVDATPAATAVIASPQVTPQQDALTGITSDAAQTPEVQPTESSDVAMVESSPVPMTSLSGTLTLDGRVQQDYTISEEGCVGLGEWRQLKPGTQVIVRDASGTVVDISALEAADSDAECAWTFAIDAPGADFFSVSIPMVTEVWFDQSDPAVQSGELELFVP